MKTKISPIIISLLLVGMLAACAPAEKAASDQLDVTVSILPEKYFVERVGGDYVNVNVMVGPGDSPHTYEPKPRQLARLAKAALYFGVGMDFERAWLPRFAAASRLSQSSPCGSLASPGRSGAAARLTLGAGTRQGIRAARIAAAVIASRSLRPGA